jgi:N-acetyl-alpha-D-muramate 1-phosphate uridylyltransferase
MSLTVAILAGGLATRLGTITEKIPKSLLRMGSNSFAAFQLRLLKKNGLLKVVFCVGHLGEKIIEEIGDGRRLGMEIHYSFDGSKLLGTGGALRKALPLLSDSFFVLYGDSYLDCDYAAVEASYCKSGKLGMMTVFCNQNYWDKSNVLFKDGIIRRYDKRLRSPEMQHIDYGLGILSAKCVNEYPENSTLDLETIYQDLLARDQLAGFEVKERFYEIGSSDGLKETREYLQQQPLDEEI